MNQYKCQEQVAAKCSTKMGWPITKEVAEYTERKWQKIVCYPCQVKLGIASGNTK